MRVPLSWLRDYVDLDLSARELADGLTMRGMEVAAIETAGADWTDVVVGRLLAVERHPNADTLWLARVDAGRGEPLAIVCGAQNIAPGQRVPVALVGALLPGGRRIERTRIRGVASEGMLCSAAELGLGEDAEGIHILPGDGPAPGSPLGEALADTVLDVDVKPNRGDALSMVGLAREVAALTGAALREPEARPAEASDLPAAALVSVRIDEPALCPRFAARWLEGVGNDAAPEWMRRRLLAAGIRPISAVVDVTNYVMHELGQPMHAYDADAVPGGRIVVRRAREGEMLTTIDHVERRLDPRMLVIADEADPIGLAGIMGGASTEVSERTERVILESAIFHGPTIRNTARRLGLRSEASMRHEKGIGADLPRRAADRAAQLISEITGARVAAGIVDNDPEPKEPRRITVSVARTERLLGIELSPGRIDALLAPLAFGVEPAGPGAVVVRVPPHRLDVREPADIAEEIGRANGYDRIVGRLPAATLPAYRPDPSAGIARVRRVLAGLGLDEAVTHALIGPDDLRRSGHDADGEHLVRIANPVSDEHSVMRPVLVASLLRGLRDNVRQRRQDVAIFEVGKVYWWHPGTPTEREWRAASAGTGRHEAVEIGIALLGSTAPRSWQEPPRDAGLDDLKGVIDGLHEALGAPRPSYTAEPTAERHPHRHPRRSGSILDPGGRAYGSFGEVHPRVAAAWDLPGRPVDAAIAIDRLLGLVPETVRASPVPAAQPIDRDLALVVDETVPAGELLRLVRQAAGPMLADLRLFDVYRGEQLGPGRVSYALALRFQPEAGRAEAGVEKALSRIRGSLRHHLGAEART